MKIRNTYDSARDLAYEAQQEPMQFFNQTPNVNEVLICRIKSLSFGDNDPNFKHCFQLINKTPQFVLFLWLFRMKIVAIRLLSYIYRHTF